MSVNRSQTCRVGVAHGILGLSTVKVLPPNKAIQPYQAQRDIIASPWGADPAIGQGRNPHPEPSGTTEWPIDQRQTPTHPTSHQPNPEQSADSNQPRYFGEIQPVVHVPPGTPRSIAGAENSARTLDRPHRLVMTVRTVVAICATSLLVLIRATAWSPVQRAISRSTRTAVSHVEPKRREVPLKSRNT